MLYASLTASDSLSKLKQTAAEVGHAVDSHAFAAEMDKRDSLAHFKANFHFPKVEGHDVVYLCGNSLGLQPKNTRTAIMEELDDWACTRTHAYAIETHQSVARGVHGHFTGQRPWCVPPSESRTTFLSASASCLSLSLTSGARLNTDEFVYKLAASLVGALPSVRVVHQ